MKFFGYIVGCCWNRFDNGIKCYESPCCVENGCLVIASQQTATGTINWHHDYGRNNWHTLNSRKTTPNSIKLSDNMITPYLPYLKFFYSWIKKTGKSSANKLQGQRGRSSRCHTWYIENNRQNEEDKPLLEWLLTLYNGCVFWIILMKHLLKFCYTITRVGSIICF